MRLPRLWIPLFPLILLMLLAPPFGASRADAAVTAQISGVFLSVSGDDFANQITLRLFLLDNRKIQVLDVSAIVGTFDRSTFTLITINARGGNDTIALSRIFGPITEMATILGGRGDDQISGGAGADALSGEAGNDVITWNPGDGNDAIVGKMASTRWWSMARRRQMTSSSGSSRRNRGAST